MVGLMRVAPGCLSLFLVVACGYGGGCGQRIGRVDVSPGEVPEGVTLPGASTVVAEFEPAGVSVHPLSRVEGSGAARRAVVHVQVVDVYGHDVKWPGVVRVEVEPNDQPGGGAVHFVDLTRGELNARAFDSISRCYVVRVPAAGSGSVKVKVRWLLLNSGGQTQVMEGAGVIAAQK